MKLFLDTAILDDIVPRYKTGLIAGITTNPTLVRNSGVDYHGFIATCCDAACTISGSFIITPAYFNICNIKLVCSDS